MTYAQSEAQVHFSRSFLFLPHSPLRSLPAANLRDVLGCSHGVAHVRFAPQAVRRGSVRADIQLDPEPQNSWRLVLRFDAAVIPNRH